MKLKHIRKRAVKNSLFRVVSELNGKMYPLGLKEEMKYIEDLDTALNQKYSKVEIANMLRMFMSYIILSNSPILITVPLTKKVAKGITEKDMYIVIEYITTNNQYIARLYRTLIQNNSENLYKKPFTFSKNQVLRNKQYSISNNMGFFNFFSSRKEPPKQPLQSKALFQLDLFTNLSQTQKFAMVTMLASLAAAPTNAERTAMAQRMMFTDAEMMGITQNMMLNYMQTHTKSNSHSVISTLRTITDTNILEWLIYSGFSIIAINQNEKACYVFFDWWKQLGYEPDEIDCIVKKIENICKRMRQINNL